MIMSSVRPRIKNGCAGQDQQEFTLLNTLSNQSLLMETETVFDINSMLTWLIAGEHFMQSDHVCSVNVQMFKESKLKETSQN
jgi:hypothetical protein